MTASHPTAAGPVPGLTAEAETGAGTGRRAPLGVAVVTGGRRGIGRATALALAAAGHDVAVTDIVEDEAAAETMRLLAGFPVAAAFFRCDVADLDGHDALLGAIESGLGPISTLVNNAGIQVPVRGDMLELDVATFDRLCAVNLRGTFFFTQAVANRMRRHSVPRRTIVTVTSSNAGLVSTEKAAYCISKAALSMASALYAVRLAAEDIEVFEVRPGLITTDMTAVVRDQYTAAIAAGLSPVPRWGEPQEVARVIATLVSGGLPFSTGEVINVGGALHIARL